MSNPKFNLIMLSAWHENGGNVLHRHFDGHPNLFVYPFESQLATPHSSNLLTPAVPQRYCWPEFLTEWTAEQAYQNIWDQELKTYLRTPHISKFKDCGIVMDEGQRIEEFDKQTSAYTRSAFIEAFFRSTFDTWKNYNRSGKETHYVGYSPPILMDTEKIFADFPDAQIVHIVRNPWSGYADTIKRPFPFSMEKYCQIWNIVQMTALTYANKYRGRFHLARYEDLVENPQRVMDGLCVSLGIEKSDKSYYPSFNGKKLESVYPWGTIKSVTEEANFATANELTPEQKAAIRIESNIMIGAFGYNEYPLTGKVK